MNILSPKDSKEPPICAIRLESILKYSFESLCFSELLIEISINISIIESLNYAEKFFEILLTNQRILFFFIRKCSLKRKIIVVKLRRQSIF